MDFSVKKILFFFTSFPHLLSSLKTVLYLLSFEADSMYSTNMVYFYCSEESGNLVDAILIV